MLRAIADWFMYRDAARVLRVPRGEEFEGVLLLGDPGTGKSQIIHQLISQVRLRRPAEAGVCFDPACEFLEAHFDPETDVVLNPLDERFLYWSPSLEVQTDIDRQLVAESFFPYHEGMTEPSRFFVDAARDIFELMLARRPPAATIVTWLCDEDLIDELVAGTEVAHKISKKAGPQRVAVLSTLAKIGKLLKMLPPHEAGAPKFSLTQWAQERRGWIFVTSTQETREALRPLQAAFLNILMKRLLSVPVGWGKANPCWLFIDEVHALGHLSMLPTFVAESRKYGVKPVFGTQSKHQFRRHYGEDALTMLAAPHLKIFLRCNEAEAAKWVADNIGEEEREKPRVGATTAVRRQGRDSINYSTFTERRTVISKEQVMSLPNLNGFWKYGDRVVPFRIAAMSWPRVAKGFRPRQMKVSEPAPIAPSAARPAQSATPHTSPPAATPLSAAQPLPGGNTPAAKVTVTLVTPKREGLTVVPPEEGIDLNF